MKTLFPRVHEATRRLLRRVGFMTRALDGCCGALDAHNGYLERAKSMALGVTDSNTGTIITNSAGCGSWLKDATSADVQDISEFLLANGLVEELSKSRGLPRTATYHDACHLAHGQKIKSAPRELLNAIPNFTLSTLPESDMCCGSAGIYNVLQPTLARKLLDRKWTNIEATKADLVVMGNPGCHSWIEQASREHGNRVRVLHTAEALEAAFSSLPDGW